MRPLLLAVLIAASGPGASMAAAATATAATLDGASLHGELRVEAAALGVGGATVPLADVDWFMAAAEPQPAAPTLGVYLVDGSWLPATAIAPGAGERLRIDGPAGRLELPLTAVRGWADGALPAAPADGADLVVGPSGPISGRIAGLDAGGLLLSTALDPQPVAIPVESIAACRLAGADRSAGGLLVAARLRADRPALRLRPGPVPTLAAAPGVRLPGWAEPPLAGARLEVDGGRRVWLSDLKPAAVEERGAFGVTWPWKADADLDGGPLSLGGRIHAKGLTAHSDASLRWDLGGRYARFAAAIGIGDAVAPEGDCEVSLLVDGQPAWSRRLRGGDPPAQVDLAVAGAKTLELRIAAGERYDIGDHVSLGSAWLARSR